eukprot:11338966-Heterocapsa_arctica.AAC.1
MFCSRRSPASGSRRRVQVTSLAASPLCRFGWPVPAPHCRHRPRCASSAASSGGCRARCTS